MHQAILRSWASALVLILVGCAGTATDGDSVGIHQDVESAADGGSDEALCGNGVVDEGERCDVAIPVPVEGCCPFVDLCVDDDPCTVDKLVNDGTCQADCDHTEQVAPSGSVEDQCCPAGASAETDADCAPVAMSCNDRAPKALNDCIAEVSAVSRGCYANDDVACASDNADIAQALDDLGAAVRGACADGDFAGLDTEAVEGRLRTACMQQSESLAWRTFGGPQGAVWPTADAGQRSCLLAAHEAAASALVASADAVRLCPTASECSDAAVDQQQQAHLQIATETVAASCEGLPGLIALTPEQYAERAVQQADCAAAMGIADLGGLTLRCGPSNAEAAPPRGEYMAITLDGDKWGTLCGDGSPYTFHIRLAPDGYPVDRVVIGLQGGGVCFFSGDCLSRMQSNPGLFRSDDDPPLESGIASNDPDESPFGNWTKVYLPYCNQDVFTGAGVNQVFPEGGGLYRYGAVNARSAIQAARDMIWSVLDSEGGAGYRPDEVVTLFGGWSAGGYGTLYNYHWLLDDLNWPRTTAFPDAGMALDNGGLGVRSFGGVLIPLWGALPNLPPYCFVGDCAVGPDNYMAISPRLKTVPEQQILVLSNQKDRTQQGDAFFEDEAFFINTMRQSYCDTKDLPGIHYYLSSESQDSTHVITLRPEFYMGEVAGIEMRDWLAGAIFDSDNVVDRAEEGNFVMDVPGVVPFPCSVAP